MRKKTQALNRIIHVALPILLEGPCPSFLEGPSPGRPLSRPKLLPADPSLCFVEASTLGDLEATPQYPPPAC